MCEVEVGNSYFIGNKSRCHGGRGGGGGGAFLWDSATTSNLTIKFLSDHQLGPTTQVLNKKKGWGATKANLDLESGSLNWASARAALRERKMKMN